MLTNTFLKCRFRWKVQVISSQTFPLQTNVAFFLNQSFLRFFFYQGFLSRLTGQQGKGRDHILFHWDDYHIFLIATLVFTRLLLNEILPLYRITIWLIDDVKFVLVCLLDDLILGFCYSNPDTGSQWSRTCIDCHPCITSEPTNQVC